MTLATLLLLMSNWVVVSAFVPGPRRAPPTATPPLSAEANAGELWKIQKVDHVSDWAPGVGTYPNPLSRKAKVPASWFVGPNDAVAATVQVIERSDQGCTLH